LLRRRPLPSVLVVGLALALPAGAGADTYADLDAPDATPPCTLADPCNTIQSAVNSAATNETVRVDQGDTYPEAVTVGAGKSLISQDFNAADSGAAIIDASGTPGTRAITVASGDPAGTIQGFTLRSASTMTAPTVRLEAAATLSNNVFDSDLANNVPQLRIDDGAASPVVSGNTFSDTVSDQQLGLVTSSTGAPQINGNGFSGFFHSVEVNPAAGGATGTPTFFNNTFSGEHDIGAGIQVVDANATIRRNLFHNPVNPGLGGTDQPYGVFVLDTLNPGAAAATLSQNRILGYEVGVYISDNPNPVTMDSDVLAGSTFTGIQSTDIDTSPSSTNGDLVATNITVHNPANINVSLQDNHLTLDSSIVAGTGGIFEYPGSSGCSIAFSHGPTTSGGDCETFQTAADPQFTNTNIADPMAFHLLSTSPMIDMGNPAAPPSGTTDIDGDPRALSASGACPIVRDIGADEFNPGGSQPDCSPPPSPAPNPSDTDPPETEIDKTPKNRTEKPKAKYGFSSDEPGSTFECAFDKQVKKGQFEDCDSPQKYKHLDDGKHKFQVRAVDPAGNVDPTPAADKFKVIE